MGRNTTIKRYSPAASGQQLDLLESKQGKLPVLLALLASPWIVSGAELRSVDSSGVGKRVEEPIDVTWDGAGRCPSAFTRTGRIYHIEAVVQVWAIERVWWDPRRRVSRRYWRVQASGGSYDLAYDRVKQAWLLVGIFD